MHLIQLFDEIFKAKIQLLLIVIFLIKTEKKLF